MTNRPLVSSFPRVNSKFGDVVDYVELPGSNMPIHDRMALWMASDILMISSVREGLNLHPLEFTFVRKGRWPGLKPCPHRRWLTTGA